MVEMGLAIQFLTYINGQNELNWHFKIDGIIIILKIQYKYFLQLCNKTKLQGSKTFKQITG